MNLGSGSLTKTGQGLWALDKANTMAGTTINAARSWSLRPSTWAAATAPLTFSGSGGILDIEPNGNHDIAYSDSRAITLAASGTILQDNTSRGHARWRDQRRRGFLKDRPGEFDSERDGNNYAVARWWSRAT